MNTRGQLEFVPSIRNRFQHKHVFLSCLNLGFVFLLLITSFSTVNAKTTANLKPQISTATAAELDSLLKRYDIKTNEAGTGEDMEKLFRARTAAHRARLSEIFLELKKDPSFLIAFPEYEPLVKDSTKTVKGLLEHDVGKGRKAVQPALQVLFKLQGYDYRNPPPNVPPDVHEKISAILKNAIGDINGADKFAMEKKYNSLNKSSNWVHLHEDLTEVLDFYDTYKSRQSEIANNGRKLDSPSQWIQKMQNEGAYSDDEIARNKKKVRLAQYIEAKDPLKAPQKFTQAEDFLAVAQTRKFDKEIDQSFKFRAKALVAVARNAPAATKSVLLGPLKNAGAAVALTAGADLLVDPRETSVASIASSLVMTSETESCDSPACLKFFSDCARKIKTNPSTSFKAIQNHSKFPECVADFFALPLQEQAKIRQDNDLSRYLTIFSPEVSNIRCDRKEQIQVVTQIKGKREVQDLLFTPDQKLKHVIRKSPKGHDRFLASSSSPLLQICETGQECKNFPVKDIENTKLLYFWHELRLGMPLETLKWTQSQVQLRDLQLNPILKCCEDKSCQAYFAQKEKQEAPILEKRAQKGVK